jgi:hypothetical protein
MKRTTIMLPDDLAARLRYEARRRGVSLADVAREAIGSYLPAPTGEEPLSFIGLGDGEPPLSDASEPVSGDVEAVVGELIGRRHDEHAS